MRLGQFTWLGLTFSGDGLWKPGDNEKGLPNWTIWLDTNNDGTPEQTTGARQSGWR